MAAQGNDTMIPQEQCTLDTCGLDRAVLSYRPTLVGNSLYAGIFGAVLLAQVVLLIRHPRTWGFFVGICCGLLLELIGYVGRVLIYEDPFSRDNFIIYLVCLTIAPAFLMAAVYLCMGRVIVAFGAGNSVLAPRSYTLVCVAGDVLSLVLQSLGGALAATSDDDDGQDDQTGVHLLVAGLIFQLVATLFFVALSAIFAFNLRRGRAARNPAFVNLTRTLRFRLFLAALALATLTIFIRSVFRVAELWGGFGSDIAQNQTEFMIFEGPMIIIAVVALTVFHPGFSFRGMWKDANWTFGGKNKAGFNQSEDQKELTHFNRLSSSGSE